jgi:hypothetical protein
MRLPRILTVDAEPTFHRHWTSHRGLHRGDASGDQRRLRHQASAEAAFLHPVGRAADIEVNLVAAEVLAEARGLREFYRHAAVELQRDRMLGRIEAEVLINNRR